MEKPRRLVKFSSCSTLNVLETPCKGLLRHTLRLLALGICDLICDSQSPVYCDSLDIINASSNPNYQDVFNFLSFLYESCDISCEHAVISFVYLNRMLFNSNSTLFLNDWAWMVLGSSMLAAKIWDDHSVWNVDFLVVFPKLKLEKMYFETN